MVVNVPSAEGVGITRYLRVLLAGFIIFGLVAPIGEAKAIIVPARLIDENKIVLFADR